MGILERVFSIKANGSTVSREIFAGITTFMTMSYIIFVNPSIMAKAGMPFDAVVISTCLAAGLTSILMGLYANYPIGLAPGMGINIFFSFSIVLGLGYSWEAGMAAVFISGIIFVILTFLNLRDFILKAIPNVLRISIPAGIGLFLALIGLQNAGLVIDNGLVIVALGPLHNKEVILSIMGFVVIATLYIRGIKGSIFIGIFFITLVSIALGITPFPEEFISTPPSIAPIFMKMDFSFIREFDFWVVVLLLLCMDIFDTAGSLLGVAKRANMLDGEGELPRVKEAFRADAVGTVIGSALGVSTVTTYVESITGVEEGGKTGLTAVTVGVLFLLSIFFYPIVSVVPAFATAPALILVGALMFVIVKDVNFSDYTDAIPAVFTIFMMPFTYSIATGIEFGILSYVVLKVLSDKAKDVSVIMYILGLLFIIKEVFFYL